ncbi:spore germination protein [Scopulibacillus cellulosilyticus]|uniref:Spore germination protein n=1 Tax=Scopulibacillus cellulosilyticus TaxID=2665665 RepID=A0ABW2Q209_9BACL
MPSIILGPIKITAQESGAVFNNGDAFYISPKTAEKIWGGSGSFPTGDFHVINNYNSATNTVDPDVNDTDLAAT